MEFLIDTTVWKSLQYTVWKGKCHAETAWSLTTGGCRWNTRTWLIKYMTCKQFMLQIASPHLPPVLDLSFPLTIQGLSQDFFFFFLQNWGYWNLLGSCYLQKRGVIHPRWNCAIRHANGFESCILHTQNTFYNKILFTTKYFLQQIFPS